MNMSLWQIISTTDLMSKGVLLVLLGMSIVCWAYALYKRMVIITKIKQLKQALTLLQNTKGMDDFVARSSVLQNTFAGELIASFIADFNRVLKLSDGRSADQDFQVLQISISQRVDEVMGQEEALIPLLSTSAQAAPLIGLFGTVWGLIHAFMGIAEQRSADISAVAPGIAEALVTTMGGLVVAIPALVLFSYIQSFVRKFESAVVELADNCLWTMKGILSSHEASMKASYTHKSIHTTPQESL